MLGHIGSRVDGANVTAHLDLVVAAFDALGDSTRAKILYALTNRPLCFRDLSIVVGVSESAVSHQLRLLRDRRLVKAQRVGPTMRYQMVDHHIAALFRVAEHHADHVLRGRPDHPYPPPAGRRVVT